MNTVAKHIRVDGSMIRRAQFGLIFLLFLLVPVICSASFGENVEAVGIAYDYSTIVDVAADNTFTYAVSHIALYVFDTVDPANPIPYSSVVLPTGGYWVATVGDYVYAGSSFEFHVYSKVSTQDREPQYVTSVQLDTPIEQLEGIPTLAGPDQSTLCFRNWEYGLTMIDVSQPAAPIVLGYHSGDDVYYHHIASMGDYLLATASGPDLPHELRIMDLSEPMSPQLVGALEISPLVDLEVVGNTIYKLTMDGSGGLIEDNVPRIVALDASNPAELQILGEFVASESLRPMVDICLAILDGVALISGDFIELRHGELLVVDVSDPADMQQLAHDEHIASSMIEFNGTNAYLTAMRVLDLSDPSNPQLTRDVERISGVVTGFQIYQGHGYVGSERNGITVLDMTDPLHPATVAWVGVPSIGGMYPYGQYLFLPDTFGYFMTVVDVSDPQTPVSVEGWDIEAISPLRMMDPLCWFRPGWEIGGYDLVDCHDPTEPEIVGENDCSARVHVVPYQDYVIGSDYNSLVIVDNSDPYNPTDLAFHDFPYGRINGIAVSDHHAFVTYRPNLFTSMNLADPADPVEMQTIDFSPAADAKVMVVQDGFAYLVLDEELHVFNVSDPANMIETGWVSLPNSPYGLEVSDDGYLYLLFGEGVLIYNASIALGVDERPGGNTTVTPARFTLQPAYPNPFNAATIFTVNLPAPSELKLRVFNVNGRQVETLFSGVRPAGLHRFSWDAAGLASGVYFIRATAPSGFDATRRVTLLR